MNDRDKADQRTAIALLPKDRLEDALQACGQFTGLKTIQRQLQTLVDGDVEFRCVSPYLDGREDGTLSANEWSLMTKFYQEQYSATTPILRNLGLRRSWLLPILRSAAEELKDKGLKLTRAYCNLTQLTLGMAFEGYGADLLVYFEEDLAKNSGHTFLDVPPQPNREAWERELRRFLAIKMLDLLTRHYSGRRDNQLRELTPLEKSLTSLKEIQRQYSTDREQ